MTGGPHMHIQNWCPGVYGNGAHFEVDINFGVSKRIAEWQYLIVGEWQPHQGLEVALNDLYVVVAIILVAHTMCMKPCKAHLQQVGF